ncbi:MAG: MarR family winged helix-turn-helix transcriptional regulator [Acidimicrobiia bacterium]
MVGEPGSLGEVAFPALLRAAWRTYASMTQQALAEAGFDDVPRNGSYVLAAIARSGAALGEVIKQLGVSKQAAGHLVDTLVTRGYLDRAVNPDDRRRLTITLTVRGLAAAKVIGAAVDRVDRQLVALVGAESVAHTRATLASLIQGEVGGTPE